MSLTNMQEQWQESQLSAGNVAYIEQLFEAYLDNPNSIPEHWRNYFDSMPQSRGDVSHTAIRDQFARLAQQFPVNAVARPVDASFEKKQGHVFQLINAYRSVGHHHAQLDPLNLTTTSSSPRHWISAFIS